MKMLVARSMLAAVCAAAAVCASAAESYAVYSPPNTPNKGVLRIFGAGLKDMVKAWETGYMKHNPNVRIADNPGGSDAAIGVLQHGTAEIAVFGREMELNDYLGFFENKGYNPTEIAVASGTWDVPGASWAPLIFVNKDNPIAGLSMEQLDGIFSSERTGGYEGYVWKSESALAAKDTIKTWGQAGLKGEWADKPINTYGYAPGGMARFFEIEVMKGGTKWASNYKQYVENGTKILTPGRESVGILNMLATLEKDKYGIGWAGMPQWNQVPEIKGIKVIALAPRGGGKAVMPSKETLADRTYPLTRSVYIYIDKEPGRPLPEKVKDFVRYVLSEEGQQIAAKTGVYFALPPAFAKEQLKKLD